MKLVDRLEEFLAETVDLNKTRIETLEKRVGTISAFLSKSGYDAKIVRFSAQGSWAHKTIIKPPSDRQEFDADLVVYVDAVEGWTPSDYIVQLRQTFLDSETYKSLASMKSRCVKVNYAGDFHLDVVPIVVERNAFDVTYSVCNRNENAFERTDGDGFRDWWLGRNVIVGSNNLIKAARLIKYLRDSKGRFSVKSVLLTTLVGSQVSDLDKLYNAPFADLPTTLKTIMDRLDDWLQKQPNLPAVENPALPGESFTRNWSQQQYENFRANIHQYREWVDDAYDEPDRDKSISKWHRVFGDEYAKHETEERAVDSVVKIAGEFSSSGDIVASILQYGKGVLARIPAVLPHVMMPPFRRGAGQLVPVRVLASERRARGGEIVRQYSSGDTIGRASGLEFRAVQGNGLPFPDTYEVQWQVVNTGTDARADRSLRGDFYPSDTHGYRFEATKYRGVHWVQAFVVNKRTGLLVGTSERFFVVVS